MHVTREHASRMSSRVKSTLPRTGIGRTVPSCALRHDCGVMVALQVFTAESCVTRWDERLVAIFPVTRIPSRRLSAFRQKRLEPEGPSLFGPQSACSQPWISNCSGCSVASLFTRMFLPMSSSNSVSQRALLPFSTFTVSGFTRSRTSAFSKCRRILRNSM